MKVSVVLMMVIANGLLATALMAEPMPLPAPGSVSAPWIERVFLTNSDISAEEAARFRIVDDAEVGRALVVGPWLAGNWSARAEFDKDFPPENVNIAGLYRTVDLPHTSPVVRCECFDTLGKRLTNVSYYLPLSSQWKPFSLRFDKFPVGTHHVRFAFGLQTHALGNVWFAQLETQPAGEHPLSNLHEPELTRDSPPPQQRGTGFFRVEKYGKTWWLIDPDGLPYFSMATPAPSTSGSRDDFDAARQHVKQLRSWGFNGLAGWHNLRYYGAYNRMLAGQGDRPMPQFCVINYHDALDSGLYHQTKAKLDWSFPECVPDQRIRASQAKHILADFFNHPSVVGAHWFTYFDSDSSARQANRGLVRVDGQPWQTLVNGLTGLHGHIHRYMSVNTK